METSNAAIRTGFAVFLAALLAGCGGGGTDTVPPSSSESSDTSHGACTQVAGENGQGCDNGHHGPPGRPLTCTQLAGMTIPA
ncbi:MAG: hypothetical protein ACHP83_15515, partial [Burkholderiales bacterium]